jgi:hypothetical protein
MKTILQIIAIVLVGYAAALFTPWWFSFAAVAFIFGFLLRSRANFLSGFVAVVILWGFQLWWIQSSAAVDLVSKVADIFPTKTKTLLMAITLGLAGLIGGFAALSGALLKPKRRKHEMRYR